MQLSRIQEFLGAEVLTPGISMALEVGSIKASDLNGDGTKVTTLGETTIRWTSFEDGGTVTYERHGVVERRATIVANSMELSNDGPRSSPMQWAIASLMKMEAFCRRQSTEPMVVFAFSIIIASWSINGVETN